ncbi:ornithine carbamoyltransferase [Cryptotrichosporon argae]
MLTRAVIRQPALVSRALSTSTLLAASQSGSSPRGPPRHGTSLPLRSGAPPHLLTLASLSVPQLSALLTSASTFKQLYKSGSHRSIRQTLGGRTVALLFSKRSTRTRISAESGTALLGGHAMFLGSNDVQLGVNESLKDSAIVMSSMVDGIFARVDKHEEVETLAKHSTVPIINALCDLYHPLQILADLLTLSETYSPPPSPLQLSTDRRAQSNLYNHLSRADPLAALNGLKVAWVGDTNNITNELMVTLPRLGVKMGVAAPKGYDKVDERVWARVTEAGTEGMITLTNDPAEALQDADVVVTDTWISMGQEEEKAARLAAFSGFQVTSALVDPHAKPDWKFMHCLPRKPQEVDDEVFYGPRSLVFPEAENRKWTAMAVFDMLIGQGRLP